MGHSARTKVGARAATAMLAAGMAAAFGAAGACANSSPGDAANPGVDGAAGSSSGAGGSSGSSSGAGASSGASSGGGGSGASSSGSGGSSSGGSSSGAAADAGDGSTALCATKVVVAPSNPVLNDFEAYTGATAFLASTPFGPAYPNGGYTGPYAYSGGGPQLNEAGTNYVLSMVTGQTGGTLEGGAQDWALDLTVTDESGFGAGLGFWMTCANASAFKGLSFWVRGQTPTGAVAVQLQTADTTSTTASQPGTCTGTCAHPSATVLGDAAIPVGPSWTQITLPWAAFTGGTRNGAAYTPTGDNLTGLVFTTGLVYTQVDAAADGAAIYGPTPANIDLQIDDVAFVP